MNPRRIVLLILIAAVVAFVVFSVPAGLSTDLTRIGDVPVTVVAVHDLNLVNSTKMMEVVAEVQNRYGDDVQFLMCDVNHPRGQAFMAEHKLRPAMLLVYRDGSLLETLTGPLDVGGVGRVLEGALGSAPGEG
jgi:hypothetical protein